MFLPLMDQKAALEFEHFCAEFTHVSGVTVDTLQMLSVLFKLLECLPARALLTPVLLGPGHALGDFPPGVHEDLVEVEEAVVVKDPAAVCTLDSGGGGGSWASSARPTGLLIWVVLIMM